MIATVKMAILLLLPAPDIGLSDIRIAAKIGVRVKIVNSHQTDIQRWSFESP
ncbi:MAG: hypothetical protein ACI845_003505 [Gammaproteobacteria bacterium]|jgi:hypothetical protein